MGFRSEAELDDWLDSTGSGKGYVASAQTMYDVSKDWYAGRMDEGWQPPTAEQAEQTFRRHGLSGEFWSLTT